MRRKVNARERATVVDVHGIIKETILIHVLMHVEMLVHGRLVERMETPSSPSRFEETNGLGPHY